MSYPVERRLKDILDVEVRCAGPEGQGTPQIQEPVSYGVIFMLSIPTRWSFPLALGAQSRQSTATPGHGYHKSSSSEKSYPRVFLIPGESQRWLDEYYCRLRELDRRLDQLQINNRAPTGELGNNTHLPLSR